MVPISVESKTFARPLSIKVIVFVLVANSILDFLGVLAPRFLALIESSPIDEFAFGVFYILLAWGLWNLRRPALGIAIPYLCYQMIYSTWFFFRPETSAIASKLVSYTGVSHVTLMHRFVFLWAAEAALEIAAIFFLFKWRSAFIRAQK